MEEENRGKSAPSSWGNAWGWTTTRVTLSQPYTQEHVYLLPTPRTRGVLLHQVLRILLLPQGWRSGLPQGWRSGWQLWIHMELS